MNVSKKDAVSILRSNFFERFLGHMQGRIRTVNRENMEAGEGSE
jgi:hypothetical protein